MSPLILLKTAILVIRRHIVRSLLTIMGIMIGIAAIIVTLSIGRGAEQRVKSQILSLGENAVYIVPGNVVDRGQVRSSLNKPARVTIEELRALQNAIPSIEVISRGHDAVETLQYGNKSAKERIFGNDANILQINGLTIHSGRMYTQKEVDERAKVAVLGWEIARNLFGAEDPVGKLIKIKKTSFMVIGVLNYKAEFWGTEDPNKRTYIPYTTAKKYLEKPEQRDQDLSYIALKIGAEEYPGITLRQIQRTLRLLHKIRPEDQDDFTIFDQQSIAQSAEAASAILQLFGLIAASISLLVGGIGVMNIMLVSVQERTREIGVRLALGATQGMVQAQFLLEAVTLSFIGGILGIGLGLVVQQVLTKITNLPATSEVMPIVISFVVTMLVGVFFGYYPARRASLMNPVDALLNK